jgi:hypothetical protein
MDVMDRIEVLANKHSEIEAQILAEERLPHPDDMKIAGLKRTKLRIKDEIQLLQRQKAS